MDNIDVIKCVVNAVKCCEPILGRNIPSPDFNNIDETDISFLAYMKMLEDILTTLRTDKKQIKYQITK